MTRGFLRKSDLVRIDQQLPDVQHFGSLVMPLSVDLISGNFLPTSWVPVAAVCMQDAFHTLSEARYALHESLAHQQWYSNRQKEPNEMSAVFFARYYLDDAALRVYSAGEHLATAIVLMLEIPQEQIRKRKRGRTSLQVVVGKHLREQHPSHVLTQAVSNLVASEDWRLCQEYRNEWVHQQPPTVAGLGIQHHRERHWHEDPENKTWTLGFGGGDAPKYDVAILQTSFIAALSATIAFAETCASSYLEVLKDHGIQLDDGTVRMQLFAGLAKDLNRG